MSEKMKPIEEVPPVTEDEIEAFMAPDSKLRAAYNAGDCKLRTLVPAAVRAVTAAGLTQAAADVLAEVTAKMEAGVCQAAAEADELERAAADETAANGASEEAVRAREAAKAARHKAVTLATELALKRGACARAAKMAAAEAQRAKLAQVECERRLFMRNYDRTYYHLWECATHGRMYLFQASDEDNPRAVAPDFVCCYTPFPPKPHHATDEQKAEWQKKVQARPNLLCVFQKDRRDAVARVQNGRSTVAVSAAAVVASYCDAAGEPAPIPRALERFIRETWATLP